MSAPCDQKNSFSLAEHPQVLPTPIVQARLFVDRRDGACLAGDLAQPLQAGLITQSHITADLSELCQGLHPGRQSRHARTVFKSAGMALQDLAAATLAYDQTMLG